MVITFDTHKSKSSNFRNDLLEGYKAHRSKVSMDYEDFNKQLALLRRILRLLGVQMIIDNKGLGHESDDYIAWLVINHKGKSLIISSKFSKPTEQRTNPAVIPTWFLSSSESLECVVEAGCVTIVRVSPRLAEREHIFILLRKFLPASMPPLISKATIFPMRNCPTTSSTTCAC